MSKQTEHDEERVWRDWRVPDELWEQIEPLLPPDKPHPLGCHNPRVSDRAAMDAIFFRLRTGCQWNALNALPGSVRLPRCTGASRSSGAKPACS